MIIVIRITIICFKFNSLKHSVYELISSEVDPQTKPAAPALGKVPVIAQNKLMAVTTFPSEHCKHV